MELVAAVELLEAADLPQDDESGEAFRKKVYTALDVAGSAIRSLEDKDLWRRAARAYYRVAAAEALVANRLSEHQKAWRVRWAEGRGASQLVVDAWMETDDPHAPFLRSLKEHAPSLKAKALAATVADICQGWKLATPGDEEDYEPSPKTIRARIRKLLQKQPEVVAAARDWLKALPVNDVDRRVLHAGSVLAAAGDEVALAELLQTIPEDRQGWAQAVWARFNQD